MNPISQNLKINLAKRREQYKGVDFEFQEIGKDMMSFFPKNQNSQIWSLFYKEGFTLQKIRQAFNICQDKDIKNIRYLIGIIRKL